MVNCRLFSRITINAYAPLFNRKISNLKKSNFRINKRNNFRNKLLSYCLLDWAEIIKKKELNNIFINTIETRLNLLVQVMRNDYGVLIK